MMKFGLLTAILDGWSFEEVVDIASQMGFKCLEVACWPAGKAERRYAGVSHIDCERVCQDDSYADYVKKLTSSKGLEISSLAFYPNTMDPDLEKREAAISHLKAVIRASAKLGVNMVTTFIGKDQHKTFEENIELFRQIWPDIIALAEQCGVKVAIENCPMLFGAAVITEDSVSQLADPFKTTVLNQWTYHARLYAAAKYCCSQPDMDLVQLVSFGCGVDAITTDETREILREGGKLYTQLKIDEITNLGAVRIRLRSLFAALEEQEET